MRVSLKQIVYTGLHVHARHLRARSCRASRSSIAANRDEFLDRAATGPELLARRRAIVGGRDLRAGGTWLAISEHGVVAGLLNRRTEALPLASKRSRGELPMLALAAGSAAAAATRDRALSTATRTTRSICSSPIATRPGWRRTTSDEMRLTPLARGLHLVSNLDVDDPTCPKIARSHVRFAAAGDAFASDRDEAALPCRAARDRRRPHADARSAAARMRSARSACTPGASARAARRCSSSTTRAAGGTGSRDGPAVHARLTSRALDALSRPQRLRVEPHVRVARRQERVDRVAVHARAAASRS